MLNAFPYASQRMPVYAENMVATSQPLAAQAGVDILRRGGNAIDAAIATAVCLTVVEPTSNGIGSDAFAVIWDGEQLHGFNSSGRSPQHLDVVRLMQLEQMPKLGWDAATIPGCVALWSDLSRRFGVLPFEDLFTSAIYYAGEGFAVSPITAAAWQSAPKYFSDFPDFQKCFCPQGRAPVAGEKYNNQDQARTLALIAESHGEDFYKGSLAQKMVAAAQGAGAAWTGADLSAHRCDQVEPVFMDYGDWSLCEIPPNGQGVAAQIALGLLKYFPMRKLGIESIDGVHLQIEAMKLAFADAFRYVADPAWMDVSTDYLLDETRLKERAAQIDLEHAQFPHMDPVNENGTVYLTTADASGMMVSLIQSNFCGFGSGIVVPHTGISLQNRGSGFVCRSGHPNAVAANKRPFHTIIPGFIMQDQRPLSSFGVMGGHMQAQGHLQMFLRMHDLKQNPQVALDAPRWQVKEDNKTVMFETGFDELIITGLRDRGHVVSSNAPLRLFGGGQIITRMNEGYCAGSDKRKDGCAVGF